MQTMEEYANWGFHFMEDKLIDDPNHFFREIAFLEVLLAFDASVGGDARTMKNLSRLIKLANILVDANLSEF